MPGNHQHAVVWQAVANFAQARSEARRTAQDIKQVRQEQDKLNASTAASAKTDKNLLTRLDQIARSRRTLASNSRDLTAASGSLKRAIDAESSAHTQATRASAQYERALARLSAAQASVEVATQRAALAAKQHALALKATGAESDRTQRALAKLNVARAREASVMHAVQAAQLDAEKMSHRVGAAEVALAAAVTQRSSATRTATTELSRLGAAGGGALGMLFRMIGGFAGFGKAAEGAASGVGMTILKVSGLVFGLAPLIPVLINASAGFLSLASALAPAVASLAAIPGFAAGAAQGILTLVSGFKGVPTAIKAGFQAFNRNGTPTSKAQDQTAANQHALKQATDSLADAQYNAAQAQKSLTDARKAALDNINQLKNAVIDAALAERGASLGLEEAQRNLQKLQATPGATKLQLAQAKLQVDQARQGLKEAKETNKSTQQQEADAAKKGVENSDVVQQAQRAQMLSVRALAEAQYQLVQAQKAVADGGASAGDAMSQYDAAMKDLTPQGRAFVKQLLSMREAWKGATDAAQEAMLPGFTSFLKDSGALIPTVKNGMADMGSVFGQFAADMGKKIKSPEWIADLKTIGDTNTGVLKHLLGGFGSLMDIFRKLAVVTAPLQKFMAKGIEGWLGNINKNMDMDRLAKFFGDGGPVQTTLHSLGQIIKNTWGAIRNIGHAAFGPSQDLLQSIQKITEHWKTWTGSLEGQNRLSNYFKKARETLKVFSGSLGGALRALGRWAETSDTAGNWKKFTDAIRPFLDAIGKLITGDAGQKFFDALTGLLQNIGDVTEVTGALGTFVTVLEKLTGALSWFLHVPFLGKTIGAIVTALVGFKALKFASQISGLNGLAKGIGDVIAGARGKERLNGAGEQTLGNKIGGKLNQAGGGSGVTSSKTSVSDPGATLQDGATKASATLQEGATQAAATLKGGATEAAATDTTAAKESAATTKTAAAEAGATAKTSAAEAGATTKISASEAAATEKIGAGEAAASLKLGAGEAAATEKEAAVLAGGELKTAAALAGGELKTAAALAGAELRAGGAMGGVAGAAGGLGGVAGGKGAKGGKLGKLGGLLGGMGGFLGGLGAQMAGEAIQDGSGSTKDVAGKGLAMAGTGAMLGSFLGPVGTAAGAALGAIIGITPDLWKDSQMGLMPWSSSARKADYGYRNADVKNVIAQGILADGGELGPSTASAFQQVVMSYPDLMLAIAASGGSIAGLADAAGSGLKALGAPGVSKITKFLMKQKDYATQGDSYHVASLLQQIIGSFQDAAKMMNVKGFKDGGVVIGSGTKRSDSVPVNASVGEFIVNADASQKYRQLLEAINSGQDISSALIDPALPGELSRFWNGSVFPVLDTVPKDTARALDGTSIAVSGPFKTASTYIAKTAIPAIQRSMTSLAGLGATVFGRQWSLLGGIISAPFKAAADNIHDVQWPTIKGDFTTASSFVQDKFAEAWTKASEFLGVDPIKKATGSWVPGAGNTDSVNARLTPGEYVIRKNAAAMLEKRSPGFLDSLNWIDRGRASGGKGYFWGEEVLSDIMGGTGVSGKGGDWTKALLGGVAGVKKDLASRANGNTMGVPQAGLGAQGVAAGYLLALKDKLKTMPAFSLGAGAYNPSAGVAQWTPTIMRVLRELIPAPMGADAGSFYAKKAAIVQMMIQHESGGNPKAINLWDINAQNGHPSQGLMQCVTVDTKILTQRGWLKHDEVEIGDFTIGYNPDTQCSEWTQITKVVHYEDAPVWRVGHANWHADVTPNHRWFSETEHTVVDIPGACPECGYASTTPRGVATHMGKAHGLSLSKHTEYVGEFVRTEEFASHHRLRLAAPFASAGWCTLTEQEVGILAWLISDGHYRPTDNGKWDGYIYQSKPVGIAAIRDLLEGVPHTESIRKPRKEGHLPQHTFRLRRAYVTDLINRAHLDNGLENFVLSLSDGQRRAFLDAFIAAEGHVQPGKKDGYSDFVRIAQINGPVQDAIRLAVFLDGWRPTFSANSAEKHGFKPAGLVGMAKPFVAPSTFHEPEVLPNQTVWCVKTGLETWTAELDGQLFLTGNTIPGTFAAHAGPYINRGILDPLANIYAGVHYALGRYGSLENVPGVRGVRNGTGYVGYKSGGWFPITDVGASQFNFGGSMPQFADGGAFSVDNSRAYNQGSVTIENLNMHNPRPERASDSLPRVIRKMTKVGVGR